MTLRTLFLSILISLPALAQDKPAPVPRRPMQAPAVSPEILPDGKVTFRCRAPGAKEVKVSGQFGAEAALTKDDNGLWSVTVGPVAGGVHEYQFKVDGMNVIDSLNREIKPQRQPGTSILHVPSNPPAVWDLQDVPHGVVHVHTYQSKALGKWRRIVVYTPPDYDARGTGWPVLYLAHGFSDNEQTWIVHGKAHWILDNLIAEKKAQSMLIVMPDAHALPPGAGGREDYSAENTASFCRELTEDVVPLVEKSYRVLTKPGARAFAGLSMGGHHALTVALLHSDTFAAVGAFSSAPPKESMVKSGLDDAAGVSGRLKLFWIACGKDDFLFQRNEAFTALLKERGLKHEYAVTEGNHSWPVWRKYLAEFAPRLFRE